MASYQARHRDPLLDQNTQAALERRGKELLGGGLIVLGVLAAMMLASYVPEDPSWMAASDQPVQNWLGRIGAGIASPLFVIVGRGAWLAPLGLLAWGLRFVLHRGEERAGTRAIFLPIAIAVAAVYAALLVPDADWGQAYGLGGHFGDMIAGSLLGIAPVSGTFGLKVLSALLAVAVLAAGAFVLGFDRTELRAIARFLMLGTIATYATVLAALGKGASASVQAARVAADSARARRAAAAERAAEQAAWDAQQQAWAAESHARAAQGRDTYGRAMPAAAPVAERVAERPAMFSRIRRAAEPEPVYEAPDLSPELIEPGYESYEMAAPAPSEDRIKARIAAAVQTRAAHGAPVAPIPVGELRAARPAAAPDAPVQMAPAAAPVAAPAATTPASVLSAVASRLARGPKLAAPIPAKAAPTLRAEPPLMARPRFLPGRIGAPEAAAAAEPGFAAHDAAYFAQDEFDDRTEIRDFEPFEIDYPEPEFLEPDFEPDYEPALSAGEALARERAAYAAETAPRQAASEPLWQEETDEDEANVFADLDDEIPPPPAMLRAERPVLNRQVIAPAPTPERRVIMPAKKPITPSKQAMAEAQPKLRFEAPEHPAYEVPPLGLLTNPTTIERHSLSDDALEENARMLENVLDDYGVKGEIVSVRPGPVVTMYELEPAPGLKASRVIGLADDIARSMSALSARVSTVPGRSVIGIELPNAHREKVVLREIISARDFGDSNMRLPLALGKDIGGEPVIANLAKMPHLLIAGTTGSGKSVAINTMILSLLYKLSPEECRLIMIDPKMLELSVYDGIPHLLSPVVTDPKKAVVALKWVVGEMEERYRRMSKMGVRNIEGYNGRVREAMARGELFKRTVQTGFDEETGDPIFETEEFQPQPFPYIVVIVDEMADLMMVAGKEIEACIQRLAQMARASGIHLIMATQRPSVDVITGTIKANFPTRISFQVTSKIDSRTILGEQGAEQLLGMGDMLYMGAGSRITRIHGPFVSDEEVEEIVTHLKSFGPPEYMSGVVDGPDDEVASDIDQVLGLSSGGDDVENALYDTAVAIVIKDRKCSTSYIQRKLGIGYNKAARLVEQMEEQGVVTAANHVGKREILVPEQ